jgi:hypothetical protein
MGGGRNMNNERQSSRRLLFHLTLTHLVIGVGIIAGIVLTMLSSNWPPGTVQYSLMTNLGCGLLATAFISLILDIIWSKERARLEKDELQPLYDNLNNVTKQLEKLEGRLEAFKQLGFNNCYALRSNAQENFLLYAKEAIGSLDSQSCNNRPEKTIINIVSSSARGLVGYLDREPSQVQKDWRNLITNNPKNFRMLLTHPAFAHLRQPAEERSSGDIELEILKTAIYFHCVSGMKSSQLRFYRGSPTVFTIQAGNHILLNPYPYGKMAMDTLCLEFESNNENSYVSNFASMHFNHTWAFINQPSKLVDGKPLVVGIDSFDDILAAFSECTFLGEENRLRLTDAQVEELDMFTCKTLPQLCSQFKVELPAEKPFFSFAEQKKLSFSGDFISKKVND